MSSEDYQRYSDQYEHIQQITKLYEDEPDNFTKLVDLLQQVQSQIDVMHIVKVLVHTRPVTSQKGIKCSWVKGKVQWIPARHRQRKVPCYQLQLTLHRCRCVDSICCNT